VQRDAHSARLFRRAQEILVGGVNSPVRAFKSVGRSPVFMARGAGAQIFDADGNAYWDYVCSWGAMILGHAHPAVTAAIQEQAQSGTSFGMATELEIELAEEIRKAVPSLERVRLVNSGTEATMSAIRLARAFTRREYVLKFEGCYHGHADSFLSQAGSGLATLGIASSPGVPEVLASRTINVPYNNPEAVARAFERFPEKIAAIIVEPVAANMGVVLPREEFLKGLRELASRSGALLIFDEVITGFRLDYGGAQGLFGLTPDLTTLGKIIGGGLPVGAYGGRAEIMRLVAPEGPVYQAGTLAGNPLAMRAGLATLKQLREPGFYERLNDLAQELASGLRAAAAAEGVGVTVNQVGSLLTVFFGEEEVADYDAAKACDTKKYAEFFGRMLEQGFLLPPSQFESWFLCAQHTRGAVQETLQASRNSFSLCGGS
jgi:glutamate-1-semialdehyde 2,1-aminomutase